MPNIKPFLHSHKGTLMNLVIVESPAKCKKISEILGPGFKVLATMGHIRALEEDLDAVGINRDFEPRFRFLKEKAKATAPILLAAKSAKTIYLAADDDREGEAIAYSVACLLKKNPLSFPRSVFHEITAKAIKEAIANPRRIDMNRVYAQQARSVLDMMVGFTISPLLWKHVAKKLSAGRCQTPALRLVVERENQIKSHTTQTSWTLKGNFKSKSLTFDAKMTDDLEDQESAMNYLENVNGDDNVTVKSTVTKPWTACPPKPLITSTLQQEASALHKVNPKSTMKIAQALYEAGHITYMRTDFAILSEEAIQEAQAWVLHTHGENYVAKQEIQKPAKEKEKAKASKTAPVPVAQEAHEAIRPTHFEVIDLPGDWTPTDKKIYALIWKRAVQSTMTAAKGDNLTLLTQIANDTDFEWSSNWKRTTFDGWQILGKKTNIDSDSENEESPSEAIWKAASSIKAGTSLKWLNITAEPKRSKASARFTEATLIRELERRGIGRPSTFASLVETLFDKTYIDKQDIPGSKAQQTTLTTTPKSWPPRITVNQISLGAEKQKLVPTPLGESVLNFCVKEFPQLFAYEFTAQMERRLDSISKGDEQWKAICRDTWTSYSDDHKRLSDRASAPSQSEKVNDFGDGFKAVMSKSGPLLVQEGKAKLDKPTFYTLPKDTDIRQLTKEEALEFIRVLEDERRIGEFEGKTIIKKKGQYGDYLESGTYKVPFVETDTIEAIIAKFSAKKESASKLTRVGHYIFTVGQYGPYMYKENVKKKNFVSIPANIDPKKLSITEADALYKMKKSTK